MNYLLIPVRGDLYRLVAWYTNERPVAWAWWRMIEKTRPIWERGK